YDLYIYKDTVHNTDGSQAANYQSASSANPEIASISPLSDGTSQYTVKVVPYTPTGESVHVTIELLPGSGSGGSTGFGGPDPTTPGVPRYQNFFAPDGTSAQSSDGEFNIGFNPKTTSALSKPVDRVAAVDFCSQRFPGGPATCPHSESDGAGQGTGELA